MHKKRVLIFLIIFSLSIIIAGCQNTAQKKPQTPNKINQTSLTDSERRILASKVSNMAEQVEGVNRASVIVARAGIGQMGFTQKTGSRTAKNNLATNQPNNPMVNYPDINSNNPNTLTDDNNRNMALPGGGVIVIIGTSVTPEIRDDLKAWNKIKETITEKVTASDGRISQVFITNDPETVGKIDELASAALQGEVSEDYEDEIRDILNEVNTP